jgi:hypothetical protein
MQARYSPLQMAMTCHGMSRGLRSAISDLSVPAPWAETSTAWKSAASACQRILRHPEWASHRSCPGPPGRRPACSC